jgi:hypothetical protein
MTAKNPADETAICDDDPAYRSVIARRIVEITDEDENLIFEFVPVKTAPQPNRS